MKSAWAAADTAWVSVDHLPPLTGSPLLDPWRIRLRLLLAGELEPAAPQAPTRSELLLWERLQMLSSEWRREYATGRYRLDFYCPRVKLAVEVDGSSHWGPAALEHDDLRDQWHALRGITTKRFSARQVELEPEWVIAEIVRLVDTLTEVPPGEAAPAAVGDVYAVNLHGSGRLSAQSAGACQNLLPPGEARRRGWSIRELLHSLSTTKSRRKLVVQVNLAPTQPDRQRHR